jgi:regulatory protein
MPSDNKITTALAEAKAIVFRFLKYRPRSEQEVIEKLTGKGVTAPVIAQTIEYLRGAKFVDDQLFARGWIASRLRKPYGTNRIRQELKQKGVSDEIIAQEFALIAETYDETSTARTLAERRLRLNKGIPKLKAKKRIYDYLVRRGFRFDVAQRAVNQTFAKS